MSSFRKALKSRQRNHQERSQPGFRKHLGLLEKKKDYKKRADDYHKKQNTLLALRKKALEKNPDEFYYHMINSQLKDGAHVSKKGKKEEDPEVTEEQKKVMTTQDIKYVEMKRLAEVGKIERLKGSLHLLDVVSRKKNKHTFFVDSKKDVQSFDLSEHLNTVPELVDRVYNRPTVDTLSKGHVLGAVQPRAQKKLSKQRKHEYMRLAQRIDREKKLFVISQKLQMRQDLQDRNKKIKVKNETRNAPAIYKFETKRKR
ncbi:probable U3 small nucleolar RNA-associated protein 11 [Hippocampus zosterae]|uniref:probable U3 small nucleolar RNA-associated protein 11 n=1 Tax=Hippocampus zosterae TaxID=109293 RepID=UPI00223DF8FA|nr:probable U3 small nucleolar RNA-associated protein 11 [Hippocampus zosterae]